MRRFRGWIVFIIMLLICAGGIWTALQVTAEYPPRGEPVSYEVNQVDGVVLAITEPAWSPFKGYTIHWKVSADSEEAYSFVKDGEGPGFEYLERFVDGQWYRLGYTQDVFPFNTLEFSLGGGEGSSLEGSIVQKYADYGTRLEAGVYRVILEMTAEDKTPYYLAAGFDIE